MKELVGSECSAKKLDLGGCYNLEKIDFSDVIKKEDNNNAINTNKIEKEKEKVEIKDETEEKEKEEIKPQAIKIKKNTKVRNEKIIKKGGKKNKITKVDFDLDFDSFNDVNFGSMEKENEKETSSAMFHKRGKENASKHAVRVIHMVWL